MTNRAHHATGINAKPAVIFSTDMPDWSGAICTTTDPDIFLPEKGANSFHVIAICKSGCPIIDACREYAIEHHEIGVWGGTSHKDRRRIRRARKDAAEGEVAA